MRKLLAVVLVLSTVLMVGAVTAGATGGDGKVYVCKYVGTPGVDEVLQTGQNPIEVSVNAIPIDPVVVGSEFADQQGRSVVIGFVPLTPEPTVADCSQTETPPTPTSPPPTPTSPPPVVTPPPVVCEPSIGLGPWYGDPQIDITLEGPARFRVRGGLQRAAHSDTGVNIRVFRVTLACNETLVIDHYKVKKGHYLSIFQNGVRIVYETPPILSR
jgi:hypothetical protein